MKLGYAGMCRGVLNTKFMHCTQKYANEDKLHEVIKNNFEALQSVLQYNVEQEIKMFRISSDFIPFATHPLNSIDWKNQYKKEFEKIHRYVINNDLRLSMHPGQYVVLNSTNPQVVERSLEELQYHADVLEAFQLDSSHKMVLHIGGIYQDKESAIMRFIDVAKKCSETILKHLVIENDDRYFTVEDVLRISSETGIPVVYDQLHHELNPSKYYASDREWILRCLTTWKESDGTMKLHYSQQAVGKRKGAHSLTINLLVFHQFFNKVKDLPLDWMIEVKDKNYSVNKINVYLHKEKSYLEKEWQSYRYLIMEHSYPTYAFMKHDLAMNACSHFWFYQYLDEALCLASSHEQRLSTAILFYEEVRDTLSDESKQKILKVLTQVSNQKKTVASLKKFMLQELVEAKSEWCNNYYLTFDI